MGLLAVDVAELLRRLLTAMLLVLPTRLSRRPAEPPTGWMRAPTRCPVPIQPKLCSPIPFHQRARYEGDAALSDAQPAPWRQIDPPCQHSSHPSCAGGSGGRLAFIAFGHRVQVWHSTAQYCPPPLPAGGLQREISGSTTVSSLLVSEDFAGNASLLPMVVHAPYSVRHRGRLSEPDRREGCVGLVGE
ncbi:hypothetical protein GQ53DRAFT_106352 [Thozetella sp. PMI_491]|nr:hypothetical protein GQ53DRAFT_106352 [Thozetella sp. PMI_491]